MTGLALQTLLYTIYQVTNLVNGKIYIGKHQTFSHHDDYMGSGKHICRAIKKYGRGNFKKEILHVFDSEEEMNQKEVELVTEEFCQRQDTYNLCPGGKGGWGYVNSEIWTDSSRKEHNRRISGLKNMTDEQKRRSRSKGGKKTVSLNKHYGFEGKKHSKETGLKISNALRGHSFQKGKKNSQFGTMWITTGLENKKIKKDDIIPDGWYKGYKPKMPA